MHSAEEAKAYAQELYLLMKYAGVTEGNLYYGNMRFDVNVSVAKKGATEWGTRVEVKNLNSFRSVERAVEHEFVRQIELIEKGQAVTQETRGWHDAKQKTFSQRSKENAHDYRYFPDADLPPIELTDADIDQVKAVMPTLPPALRTQLQTYGISTEVANTLIAADADEASRFVPTVFEVAQAHGPEAAVFTANFIVNRFAAYLQEEESNSPSHLPTATQFGEAYELRKAGNLSSNAADAVLLQACGKPVVHAKNIAESLGLLQENDRGALEKIVDDVLADPAHEKAVNDIKAGEQKVLGFLVGQVMKRSQGKANPGLAAQVLRQRLGL
jgi:aspartyl-tRNA(Asn)/glutamyl-tRNA(Gln) amidotransferase subunit B